jgi:DNA-binding transcriptional LysR family regulator
MPNQFRSRRNLDDLQTMVVFARVVETGSFTSAARSLLTSTSSVSKRIAQLEQRLGVRLVERTTRSMAPTEAGLTYYERCAQILRDVEQAELVVTELGSTPRGTLRVSAPTMLGEGHLASLAAPFLAMYPDLRLEVNLDDRPVNLVTEGYDLAIRGMRPGATPDSSLIARRLATVDLVVVAAPSYLARRGVPQTPHDLAGHDCLHFSAAPLQQQWSFTMPPGVRVAPVTTRLAFNSLAALREAAIAGCGLTRISLLTVVDAIRAGTLQLVLPDYAAADLGLYAVYPAGKQPLPKVKAYVDFLAVELPQRFVTRCEQESPRAAG